jgi:hypothetical protein
MRRLALNVGLIAGLFFLLVAEVVGAAPASVAPLKPSRASPFNDGLAQARSHFDGKS